VSNTAKSRGAGRANRPAAGSPERAATSKSKAKVAPTAKGAPTATGTLASKGKPAAGGPAGGVPIPLYIVSDSTGNLARHMATAFLTQFPPGTFELRLRPFVDTLARLEAGFAGLTTTNAIVFHAVVNPAMKARLQQLCTARGFPAQDLTGSFVDFLAAAAGVPAEPNLVRLHHLDDAYERRVAAMEFTLCHDDGLGLSTLGEADVVLTGVSRTSKTPTSIYLAQDGFKAANVSLAVQCEPPAELMAMPKGKVAALVIDPARLSEIRLRRNEDWKMSSTDYDRLDAVRAELAWCRKLFARQGWAVFDITGMAIEETAARVVQKLGLRR
jgi:regulator of PEP synthase PpsR (kinase-PPPase family)